MKLKTNFLLFFSKGKHRLHNPSPRSSLYNLYFMQCCAFMYLSSMEPSCTMTLLTSYLVTLQKNKMIEWLCLVI
jgi:hypothetical protein